MTSQSFVTKLVQTPVQTRFFSFIAGIFGFTALTGLAAQFTVPIPFSPVPLSLQVIPAFLAGAFLGPVAGFVSMALYAFSGILGFPVFSFGRFGLIHLMGPTGGYIIGYAFGSYVVGRLVQKGSSYLRLVMAFSAGMVALFACGLLQLNIFNGFDWSKTLAMGFYPFILQDIAKIFIMAGIFKGYKRVKK